MAERESPRVDFGIVVDNRFIDDHYKNRIASLNNLRSRDVEPGRIARLYEGIQQQQDNRLPVYVPPLFQELITYIGLPLNQRERSEKVQAFQQHAEGLLGKGGYASYGIHAPSYLTALTFYQDDVVGSPQGHSSLLVGAYTPATISEYAAITDHVFPNADLHVIDVDGVTTARLCEGGGMATFHKGDALQMPFPDNTFSSVQSDHLL